MSTVVDPGGPGIEPLFYDQYFERAHMDGTTQITGSNSFLFDPASYSELLSTSAHKCDFVKFVSMF